MARFETTLVPGGKPPYDRWTFLVVPSDVAAGWGRGRKAVRGTLAGTTFRGTLARGEGVLRMPVPKALRERAGVRCGDTVRVVMEPDAAPRPIPLPAELRALLDADDDLAARFERLPPSMRRAWAQHVGEAKRPETRARRAARAPDGIRARAFPR